MTTRLPRSRAARCVAVTLAAIAAVGPAVAAPEDTLRTSSPGVHATPSSVGGHVTGATGSVSEQTGTFSYSYPIVVPPGRLGMAPSLALLYASDAPLYGTVAAGWSLSLPEIIRERGRIPSTTNPAPWAYRSTLPGGGPLYRFADPVNTGELAYRAVDDASFTRYRRVDDNTWQTQDPNGVVHRFVRIAGQTTSTERFVLESMRDRFGNEVRYRWEGTTGPIGMPMYDLAEITYTFNHAQGLEAHARVLLDYDPPATCGDAETPVGATLETRGPNGKYLRGARRLRAIRTEVMDRPLGAFRPVRSYALGYAPTSCTAQHGAIRLLTSIQETAASPEDVETTLPATTFEYGVLGQLPTMLRPELAMPDRGGLVTHGLSIGVPPSGLQETIRDWSFLNEMVMDIDGDGSQDLLSTPWQCSIVDGRQVCGLPSSCNMFIRRNPGGRGFAQAATPFPLPGVWADKYCTLLGQPLEAPVGLQPPGDTSVENGEETRYNHYRYLDFDGDGKVDQLSAIFEPAYGSRPDLLKPNCDPQVPNPGGVACDARAEVTPPVREDMLIYRDSQYYDGRYIWRLHRGRGDGGFESAPQFVWSPIPLDRVGRHPFNVGDTFEFIERKYDLVDIDGDGFLDAVWTEPGVVGMWAVWRGNGSGFTGQSGDPFLWPVPASMPARTSIHTVHAPTAFFGSVTTVTSTLMDTNGDGLIDLVVQDGANGVFSYLNTGVGFSRTRVAMMPAGAAIESTQTLPITLDNNAVRNSRMFLSRLADLDGDGLPERIVFTPASQGIQTGIGTVAIRHGIGTDLDTLRSTSFSTQGALGSAYGSRGWTIENFVIAGDLIDIDGDGYLDAVGSANTIDVRPADGWYEYYIPDRGREVRTRNPNATPPGILHTIRSGRDDTTVIAYATRNDPNVVRCPAAAPGAGCPAGGVTPRHVVSQVSVTSTGRSAAAVTSYRYDDAQVTRNIRGEAAFAGFAAVQVITPGDGSRRATTRRTYRYDQDHRGRLETETVLDGTTVLSHRENTYERQRLNQWPSGVLLDASTTTWACTRRTGTQAHQVAVCKENDNRLASTTTWQAVGPGGPPPGGPSMWLPHTTTTAGRSRVGGERKRTDVVTHQVVSDATSFLVLETDRTSDDTAAGVTTRLARTITEYEPGNLGLVRKVHRWIQGEDYATTVLKQRPTTGVLLWAQKAEQYAAAPDAPDESRLKTTLTYDERDLFVRETVNEVGHVTQTTIDLGTGAATGQYGPTVWRGPECSPRTCQRFYLGTRSEVDGFGRVVKQWRHSDTELPFDFPAPQISAVFTYTDAAGQPAVIESEIYRVLGDATTAVRQRATTDGTGLVLATLRHGSGNIPETGTTYTYTEAGMVKTVTGVDPSDDARTATTTHQYDALGRPTSAMRPDSTGMLVGYSGHETTTTETALGKDPGPLAVKVAYSDAFGNLVRSVEDGSATTTYTVDSAGRTGQIQDADGHVVTFTHDGLGRRRSITRGNRTWHYGFDRNGNLTSITAPHDGGDATAYTTTIAYDAVDRPTSRVQGTRALTASDLAQLGSGSATWIYDEGLNANTTGRLTTETTAVGTNSQLTRRYAYDIPLCQRSCRLDLSDHGGESERERWSTPTV
jgi:YD repeat-containing protein